MERVQRTSGRAGRRDLEASLGPASGHAPLFEAPPHPSLSCSFPAPPLTSSPAPQPQSRPLAPPPASVCAEFALLVPLLALHAAAARSND